MGEERRTAREAGTMFRLLENAKRSAVVAVAAAALAVFVADGKLDLLLVGDYKLTVLLGDGSGRFTAAPGSPFSTGFSIGFLYDLVVADFNGDGKPDLAAVSDEGRLLIRPGKGDGA